MSRYVGLRSKLTATALTVLVVSGAVAWGVFEGLGGNLWLAIALSVATGVTLAIVLSEMSARWITAELGDLVQVARERGGRTHGTIPEPGHSPQALVGSFRRLSHALEESLAELAEARDRFSAVVERIDEGLTACDPTGRVTMANSAARKLLFGLRPEDTGISVEGRPLLELVRIPVINELLALTTNESREFETPGPPRRSLVALVHPNDDGSRVIVVRDVTSLRRLERMRRDFVSNVSHELRTPISVISANSETLLDGALDHPEQARRFCQAISRNAERLGGLVEDLLDLNRIETGRQRIDIAPIALSEAVRSAVEMLAPKAESRSVVLEVAVDADVMALGDRRAVDQVLVNLIDNAIKYGGDGATVRVVAERRGSNVVRVSVRDDGPGIDPTHRGRVFERFYRVDAGRARHMGGMGLGLAIVKHLVESMGGGVGVEGARPRGSVFWFDLRTAEPAARVVEGVTLGAEETRSST